MSYLSVHKALAATSPVVEVTVQGWVRTRRDAKDFSFIELNDGSCLANIQIIVDATLPSYASYGKISTGAAIAVTGALVESLGKGQRWEVHATGIHLYGAADPESFPLQKKRHSDEFLRSIAHLRPRTNKFGAMFRIRSEAAFAVHEFFRQQGYYHVHTPILTGADCEGAGELFRVTTLPVTGVGQQPAENPYATDFFGKECFLTVSGQLEAEALAMGLGRVYTFGPTFRAEKSNTARHCAEFWMIEPEVTFATLETVMDLGENLTRSVISALLERCAQDIELFDRFVAPGLVQRLQDIANTPFARMSYREAIKVLVDSGKNFEYPVSFGLDLQTEHERYLAEEYCKKPVIVFDYPKDIKAFYMRLNDDNETVAAMDLLVPRIGELIGGSQREDRLELMEQRIRAMGQNPDEYWWYLELRKFGSVPHGGFGMGFERLLMLLTGVSNIRDVIPFPRTPDSLEF